MTVIAFISSVLLALIIGFIIGAFIDSYDNVNKKHDNLSNLSNLSKMSDEEIKARYIL